MHWLAWELQRRNRPPSSRTREEAAPAPAGVAAGDVVPVGLWAPGSARHGQVADQHHTWHHQEGQPWLQARAMGPAVIVSGGRSCGSLSLQLRNRLFHFHRPSLAVACFRRLLGGRLGLHNSTSACRTQVTKHPLPGLGKRAQASQVCDVLAELAAGLPRDGPAGYSVGVSLQAALRDCMSLGRYRKPPGCLPG